MTIASEFTAFFGFLATGAAQKALDLHLPLVGAAIQTAAANGLDLFGALKSQIDGALSGAPVDADGIASALTAAGIPGVTAVVTTGKVSITIEASETLAISLPEAALDIGGNVIGLDARADFDASLNSQLDVALLFDPATQQLTYVDNGGEELKLGLDILVDLDATASLGVLAIKVSDALATPEITLDFSLDIDGLSAAQVNVTASGAVDLRLDLETVVPDDALPTIYTQLAIDWDFDGNVLSDPSIRFEDVSIGLGSLVERLAKTISPITEIFGDRPFKQIISTLTDPLPIIDEASALIGTTGELDRVPGIRDGTITLLDLAALYFEKNNQPQLVQKISDFAMALSIIKQLTAFNEAGDIGRINLGSIEVTGSNTSFTGGPEQALAVADRLLADSAIFGDVVSGIKGVVGDQITSLAGGFSTTTGLKLPLLEDPGKIVNLLLPGLSADPADNNVSLVEFTLDLPFDVPIGPYFYPILGPIGLNLGGQFAGGIGFTIGYDTNGLQTGNVADGLFLKTAKLDDPATPDVVEGPTRVPFQDRLLPVGTYDSMPLGYLYGRVEASAGFNVVLVSGGVGGGILGKVYAFLPDGALRPGDIADGCIFDPLTGKLTAEVFAEVKFGLGPFSHTERYVFADVTLANFSYGCGGGTSDVGFGLAISTDAAPITLAVGDFAFLRRVDGKPLADTREAYRVRNAVDEDGQLIAGSIGVSAFGIEDIYGTLVKPVDVINGNFGSENDTLFFDAAVTQKANVDGGSGRDFLSAALGDDTLRGGSGNDVLRGHGGNDALYGDEGDDALEGGAGADTLNGGLGKDHVDYRDSDAAVIFRPTSAVINDLLIDVVYTGKGGEAEGDQLISIEGITGTRFNDQLYGNIFAGSTLLGLAGADVLIGGAADDFLLGGEGADVIDGLGGRDATSYIGSFAGVSIDLTLNTASGGEANGDRISNIDDVQGSVHADVLTGNTNANRLDGSFGDDRIDGRGGADEIRGGDGNDTVLGNNNGGVLDGGGGIDLLSYAHLAGPVFVNLRAGTTVSLLTPLTPDRLGTVDGAGVFTRATEYGSFENLDGSLGNDTLTGDLGGNIIRGLNGNDVLDGEGGADTLMGGSGADVLEGGAGLDWADYSDGCGVTVNLAAGTGQRSFAQGDTLQNIENLRGTDGDDVLTGDAGDNILAPGLSTTAGLDQVAGGDGVDTLVMDYSRDDRGAGLSGGFSMGSLTDGLFSRKQSGSFTVDLDRVRFTGMDQLDVLGTIRGDQVYGGALADRIFTGDGNDFITTGKGNDVVDAGTGNDNVTSGSDADRQLEAPSELFIGNLPSPANLTLALDGGLGVDRLSISLVDVDDNIVLKGGDGTDAFEGKNLLLANGTSIQNFEILQTVYTEAGNDSLTQAGRFNNTFATGVGQDTLAPGLGIDTVDGGFDFTIEKEITTSSGFDDVAITPAFVSGPPTFFVKDADAFARNAGDVLRLDYSGWTGMGGIQSAVSPVESNISIVFVDGGNKGDVDVATNEGFYSGGAAGSANETRVNFREIERLEVIGSGQGDLLTGTEDGFFALDGSFFANVPTLRGDDFLVGGGGDDTLLGRSGDDTLSGGDGDDIVNGAELGLFFDRLSARLDVDDGIDKLTGGSGADRFVLGNAEQGFYGTDRLFSALDRESRAIITDFNAGEGDRIVLHGSASEYGTTVRDGSTLIVEARGLAVVAELQGITTFDLTSSSVTYVDNQAQPVQPLSLPGSIADLSPLLSAALPGDLGTVADVEDNVATSPPDTVASPAIAASTPSWVTQTNDTATLQAALVGSNGAGINLATDRLTISGNASAFGTIAGDPFGLGSGIVLSTGRVEDLAGANSLDGGLFGAQSAPLTFEFIGRIGATDIFRAEITDLASTINSITLRDSGSRVGGGVGAVSGFDIDNIMLSRTRLESVSASTNINNNSVLPKVGMFDFSADGLFFKPGTQRDPAVANLLGSSGAMVLDAGHLGIRDASSGFASGGGILSLGDGGELGINLLEAVSAREPLYLYVGEWGGTGETLEGLVSVSDMRIQPRSDLSTDLGRPGAVDDTTALTYAFTPLAGFDTFTFDFVLFSEELPEWAGKALPDTYKITLNGVDMGTLSNGASTTASNLLTTPFGPASPDLRFNPIGTGPSTINTRADAYTTVLTFSGLVTAGVENVLKIEVADHRDGMLDAGIAIRGGSFGSSTQAGITVGAGGTINEGGAAVALPVTFKPGSATTSTVAVTFDPSENLDLGNGAGQALTVTFGPGLPLTLDLQVRALADGIDAAGVITVTTSSTDGRLDDLPIAPVLFDLIEVQNGAPDAVDDTDFATSFGMPLALTASSFLGNDSDPDGDALTVASVQGAVNGAVTLASDGTITFVPAAGFSGLASFGYTVSDGRGGVDTATVSLRVGAPSSISGSVYVDADNDGQRGTGEAGIAGVTMQLLSADGAPVDLDPVTDGVQNIALTDVNGDYVFANLKAGIYTVVQAQTAVLGGFVDGKDTAGTANGVVDTGPGSDAIRTIALPAATAATGYLFGELLPNAAPVIVSDGGGDTARITVDENRRVVTTVNASDSDSGQRLTYAIVGGADAALFAIDARSGVLSFIAAPDSEAPRDAGLNNTYDVVVAASDNGVPSASDSQALSIDVLNVAETSLIEVTFRSSQAGYDNVLGWYDVYSGKGEVLFRSLKDIGSGATVSFEVPTTDVGSIRHFFIPNGSNVNSDAALSGELQIVEQQAGTFALAKLDASGAIMLDANGSAVTLQGAGAPAFFSEPWRNPGNVDHASVRAGTTQTASTLTRDTTDGPGGSMAWEDLTALPLPGGGYTRPGDADYDDAVFTARVTEGRTVKGSDSGDKISGQQASDVFYGFAGNDTLSGGAGDDDLNGGSGADWLNGGAGDDVLSGGAGNDALVFKPGFGSDVVTDFTAGLGVADVIRFHGFGTVFDTFIEVMAVTAQSGADTVIEIDANNTITLQDVARTSLVADDFRFV